jgi:PAS domain S-box-containing protein
MAQAHLAARLQSLGLTRDTPPDAQQWQRLLDLLEADDLRHASEGVFSTDIDVLRDHKHFLEKIFNASPDVINVFDLFEQRCVYLNREGERLLGYPAEHIKAMGAAIMAELIHPADLAGLNGVLRYFDTMADGETVDTEFRMRHANGDWRWLQSHAVIFARSPEGRARYVLGITRDITEQKQVSQALVDALLFGQQITNFLPHMVYVYDIDARQCIYSNDITQQFYFGEVPSAQVIDSAFIESRLHPDDHDQSQDYYAWITNAKDEDVRQDEFRLRNHSGDWRWMRTQEVIFNRHENGQPRQILGVSFDITDERLVQQREVELTAQQQTITVLRQLLNDFLHDIRTPLATFNTSLYLTKRKLESGLDARPNLDVMEHQVQYIISLLDDIVEMSQVFSASARYSMVELDVNNLINTQLASLGILAQSKQQRLLFEPAEGLPRIQGDGRKLVQVIRNLVKNAVQFTPPGGSIRLTTCYGMDQVLFEVSDTGIGIRSDELDRIFDLFYKADKSRSSGVSGAGLGLSIARRIVEAHHGRIAVRSTPGVGTTFSVWLPVT